MGKDMKYPKTWTILNVWGYTNRKPVEKMSIEELDAEIGRGYVQYGFFSGVLFATSLSIILISAIFSK